MKVSNISLGERIFALFIGVPGSGKTLAGASFHEAGPMLFLDFDGRMKPVRLYYPEADVDYESFNVKNLEKFAYELMPKLMDRNDFRTVHLAGITSLTMTAVTYQMFQKNNGDGLKKTKGGLMVPSWDEFNGEAMIVSQILDALKSLRCNVIVEAHPVNRIDTASGGKYTSLVSFGPKVESLIPGYFDEIYYFNTETDMSNELTYKCRTRPGGNYPLAKTSLPLPSEFVLSESIDGRVMPKKPGLYKMIQDAVSEHGIKLEV